ncbi:hypothetical protein CsSME_00013390 [Camellia sinensis var. sinensis]
MTDSNIYSFFFFFFFFFFFSRFCVCDWETIKDAGVGLTQRAWKVSLNLQHRIAVMKVAQGSRNSKLCMDGLFSGWKQSGHGPSVVVYIIMIQNFRAIHLKKKCSRLGV